MPLISASIVVNNGVDYSSWQLEGSKAPWPSTWSDANYITQNRPLIRWNTHKTIKNQFHPNISQWGAMVHFTKNVDFPNSFYLDLILLEILSSLRCCLSFSSMSKGKKVRASQTLRKSRVVKSAPWKSLKLRITGRSIFKLILIILLKYSISHMFVHRYTNNPELFNS